VERRRATARTKARRAQRRSSSPEAGKARESQRAILKRESLHLPASPDAKQKRAKEKVREKEKSLSFGAKLRATRRTKSDKWKERKRWWEGCTLAEGGRGLANPFVPEKDDDEPSTGDGDGAGLADEPANGPATPLAGVREGAGPPGDAKDEEGDLKGACDVVDGDGRPVAVADEGRRERDGEKEETGAAEEEGGRAAEAEEEEPRDEESESSEPSGPPPPGRFRLLTRFFRASSSLAFLASSLFCASSIFKQE
jgi:hypothetical protein